MGLFVSFLSLTDAGRNEFQLISGDKDYLIVRDLNVDADGKETELVGLFGRYDILKFPLTWQCYMSTVKTHSEYEEVLTVFRVQGLYLYAHRIKDPGR